uniref:DUF4201 domain-containing protein n=1 Tax=Heterorhabditis bacteriophora TaxID=37862 RepID=A0A1I7XVF1_HETBA
MALEEERDKNEEGLDENFSIFRHQAATVERRKNGIAQKLQEARQELTRLEAQVEEKKEVLRSTTGADVMSVHQFKIFVAGIRNKKVEYKKKKSIIEEFLTERELMMRTIDILSKKFESLKDRIESMGGEVEEAIPIPVMTRPMTAVPQFNNIEELRYMIKELMDKLDKKRDEIEPLKRTREEKQKEFNIQDEIVRNRKSEYERRKIQLESGYTELKTLVGNLEERFLAATSDVDILEAKIKKATEHRDRLRKEEEGESINDVLEASIREAEEEAENLSRRCEVKDGITAMQQVVMWRALLTMFEAKLSMVREHGEPRCARHPLSY